MILRSGDLAKLLFSTDDRILAEPGQLFQIVPEFSSACSAGLHSHTRGCGALLEDSRHVAGAARPGALGAQCTNEAPGWKLFRLALLPM